MRAHESKFNEEIVYQNSRKKSLAQLSKKGKHSLLFTNFETLDFVNVNNDSIVKAWTVLFHFRSQNTDTQVYEEFNSIVTRNSFNKSRGHDLFKRFFTVMTELSLEKGYRI